MTEIEYKCGCGKIIRSGDPYCPYCGRRQKQTKKNFFIMSLLGIIISVVTIFMLIPRNTPEPTEATPSHGNESNPTTMSTTEQTKDNSSFGINLTPTVTETATELDFSTPKNTPIYKATITSTPAIGTKRIRDADSAVEIYIPAGDFTMGSNEDGEKPIHIVYLAEYWIDELEITNEQFARFLNDIKTSEDQEFLDVGYGSVNHIYYDWMTRKWLLEGAWRDHPVVNVSWLGAQKYCEWAGGRLPTEAEWEKAARGDDGRIYPWGNNVPSCSLANYSGCGGASWTPGSSPESASPYGVMDMAGNVEEWVADWYDVNYYETSPYENPTGPVTGEYHVRRGGSYESMTGTIADHWNGVVQAYDSIRTTARRSGKFAVTHDLGFRCAND